MQNDLDVACHGQLLLVLYSYCTMSQFTANMLHITFLFAVTGLNLC